MIAVVDYGVGNLYSLTCSLRRIGAQCVVTRDERELREAERIILPGVGAFGDAADRLRTYGLDGLLGELAAAGKPLLGICLGMQLLFDKSFEYGEHAGLGLIRGVRAGDFVYYVHSFYAAECDAALVATSAYGGAVVAGVVRNGNVCGTQFHPEKSGEVGLRMLKAFAMEKGAAAC